MNPPAADPRGWALNRTLYQLKNTGNCLLSGVNVIDPANIGNCFEANDRFADLEAVADFRQSAGTARNCHQTVSGVSYDYISSLPHVRGDRYHDVWISTIG